MHYPLRHAAAAMLCAALLGISCAAGAAGIKSDLKIAFVPKQINQSVRGHRRRRRHGRHQGIPKA